MWRLVFIFALGLAACSTQVVPVVPDASVGASGSIGLPAPLSSIDYFAGRDPALEAIRGR